MIMTCPRRASSRAVAEILRFPSQNTNAWSAWEPIYRKAANEGSWPPAMTEAIVARMKEHHWRIGFPRPVTFVLPRLKSEREQAAVDVAVVHGIRQIEGSMCSVTDALFVAIFHLEIERYRTIVGR